MQSSHHFPTESSLTKDRPLWKRMKQPRNNPRTVMFAGQSTRQKQLGRGGGTIKQPLERSLSSFRWIDGAHVNEGAHRGWNRKRRRVHGGSGCYGEASASHPSAKVEFQLKKKEEEKEPMRTVAARREVVGDRTVGWFMRAEIAPLELWPAVSKRRFFHVGQKKLDEQRGWGDRRETSFEFSPFARVRSFDRSSGIFIGERAVLRFSLAHGFIICWTRAKETNCGCRADF